MQQGMQQTSDRSTEALRDRENWDTSRLSAPSSRASSRGVSCSDPTQAGSSTHALLAPSPSLASVPSPISKSGLQGSQPHPPSQLKPGGSWVWGWGGFNSSSKAKPSLQAPPHGHLIPPRASLAEQAKLHLRLSALPGHTGQV